MNFQVKCTVLSPYAFLILLLSAPGAEDIKRTRVENISGVRPPATSLVNSHPAEIKCFVHCISITGFPLPVSCSMHRDQGSFLKKRTLGTPSSSAESARKGGWGYAPSPETIFQFWTLNRRILVQTECFLYSSPKAGLNAVPTVKITLGTPFPGIPAGNDP